VFFFDIFRSFLPQQNPIGFSGADFIELTIAAVLVVLVILSRARLEPYVRKLAQRTGWCMLFLAVLPVALRLLLLRGHPVPSPDIYDEFDHLFVADTLRHFRLANPAHPLHRFFETFFILQQPTYSSIYPIGQGLSLAVGWTVFGHPWAGVLLSTAALCSLCYWMLRAWTTPLWSLAGGLLAVFEFGPLSVWMNSYWGGALAAAGGCLVFGALPRLRQAGGIRNAVLLGIGVAINVLTRPFESTFLVLSVALYFLPVLFLTTSRRSGELRALAKQAGIAVLVVLPAVGITLLQNRQVTGSWTTWPYTISQYQYGVPASLTFQPNPVPHNVLTREQELEYKTQRSFHGEGPETVGRFLARLEYRVRYYRFFFLPPLYLALPFFFAAAREYRFAWVLITLAIFAAGTNLFPFLQLHYLAAVTCLFVLVSVIGLQKIGQLRIGGGAPGRQAAHLVFFLCAIHFGFWYGVHLFENAGFAATLRQYENGDTINHENPERRIFVARELAARELAKIPSQLLVFVRYYYPQHMFQEEWVYNAADIDGARVVWARDLGEPENQKLRDYYPGRTVLLLEPDFRPPRLSPYQP
jgi:hypothetical protein